MIIVIFHISMCHYVWVYYLAIPLPPPPSSCLELNNCLFPMFAQIVQDFVLQSLGWLSTSVVAWYILSVDLWTKKRLWSYMTLNVLTETRCHQTTHNWNSGCCEMIKIVGWFPSAKFYCFCGWVFALILSEVFVTSFVVCWNGMVLSKHQQILSQNQADVQ